MHLLFSLLLLTFPLKNICTINNKTIDIDTIYSKKPVYISFWALWCSQCIKELDRINKLKDSLDIFVIAINEDGKRKRARVANFVKGHKWRFPVSLDEGQKLMREFGVLALPSSFLYDTKGNRIRRFTGFSPKSEKIFIKIIDSLQTNVDTISHTSN